MTVYNMHAGKLVTYTPSCIPSVCVAWYNVHGLAHAFEKGNTGSHVCWALFETAAAAPK